MKALEVLTRLRNDGLYNGLNHIHHIDEAIAELEALQSRSCEGCKHHIVYDMPEGNIDSCLLYERDERLCARKFKWLDRYEAKEQ